ncbi:hypothetical protein IVB44_19380 [Bradyrhizobium sp. 49]|uniref:hypothetical protein n=1 Tax=unclassified Bradyrhizobium TaxID=2631580 RepID=UPI001FF73E14|nr:MULTISPECIES: hypothetical protein [unclassified Bradyrhizobium]MCK1268766.1 hypothetical protein [Bradyrhizobium sp. 84]MCK1373136.1 hypothetical protein [Bradyrhizobium sp. 49]
MDEYRAEHPGGWLQPILQPLPGWSKMISPSAPGAWAWREAVLRLRGHKVPVFEASGPQRLAHVFVACWSIQPHVCHGALVASGG